MGEDLQSFEKMKVRNLVLNEISRFAFSIRGPNCKKGSHWRLTDGKHTYPTLMSDEAFVSKVNTGQVSFRKGDVIICNLRTRQQITKEGVISEYEVVEVLEHLPASQLLFDGEMP